MKNFLDTAKIFELRKQHRVEHDDKSGDRIKAVLWSKTTANPDQDRNTPVLGRKHDCSAPVLVARKREADCGGGGPEPQLSKSQMKVVVAELEKSQRQTALAISDWIQKKSGIWYTVLGLTNLLHRLGFSCKRPCGVAAKADPTEQTKFRERYAQMMATGRLKGVVLFADASRPTMETKICLG